MTQGDALILLNFPFSFPGEGNLPWQQCGCVQNLWKEEQFSPKETSYLAPFDYDSLESQQPLF